MTHGEDTTGGPAAHVLVGFASSLSAVEVSDSLLRAGYRVSLFARDGTRAPAGRLRRVELLTIPAPEKGVDAAVEGFRRRAAELAPDLILPIDDAALWLVARAWPERGGPLAVPDVACIAFALDKRRQLEAARAAGLEVPDTIEVESPEDLARISSFPVLLRPALAARESGGKLGRGRAVTCADRAELDEELHGWRGEEPLLAQPFLTGRGEGVFGCMQDGVLRSPSAHRRVRMMNPHGSGASACTAAPLDEHLRLAVEAMGRAIGWQGMFMVELLRDANDRSWFIEWNGRAWGSMALARSRGLEYPAWTVDAALDRTVDWAEPSPGEGDLCRHAGREILHVLHVLRGPRSSAVRDWPSRWKTLVDVLHLRRSDRWYNLEAGGWRLFLADTMRTVASRLRKSDTA